MTEEISERINLHKKFWDGERIHKPLVSFRFQEYFFSRDYKEAMNLLVPGQEITPEMINVDEFLPDYERIYQKILSIGQSGFWVAEPFTAIPWMEGILGCKIYATEGNFVTKPYINSINNIKNIEFNINNKWCDKYLEFLIKLESISKGRFPIGQPIMRGPSDMVGAILGQESLVFGLIDNPDEMKSLFSKVTDAYLDVINKQYGIISDFHGGYSMGFYHVWTPGKCIWFQEDLSAFLSPKYYSEFLKEPDEKICRDYDYTAAHIHPSSFFILDDLIKIDRLKAIEINKDLGGPSVKEMLAEFRKVIRSKRLIIYGSLTINDIELLYKELSTKALYFNIAVDSIEDAQELLKSLESNVK
jgi:hypothetical protein